MAVKLDEGQIKAIQQMKNGCILCGGVGSGKSRTALQYYYQNYVHGDDIRELYIITTAKKRDTHEWEEEIKAFDIDLTMVHVDSWNNIKKYTNVIGAFFMFDEQRVVGYGAWTKAFLRITKLNKWVLLSATPGDTWIDYIPVFIANGFYKNKTENHALLYNFLRFKSLLNVKITLSVSPENKLDLLAPLSTSNPFPSEILSSNVLTLLTPEHCIIWLLFCFSIHLNAVMSALFPCSIPA